MNWIILGAGFLAGIVSGLLGLGGGIILVPALTLIGGFDIRTAVGTSLWVIIPTALFGAVNHLRLGNVNVRSILWVAVASVLGSLLGSQASDIIPMNVLRKLFAVVLVVTAVRMLR